MIGKIRASKSQYNGGMLNYSCDDLNKSTKATQEFYIVAESSSRIMRYGGKGDYSGDARCNQRHKDYKNLSNPEDYTVFRFKCKFAKRYERAFFKLAEGHENELWNSQFGNGEKVYDKYVKELQKLFITYNFKFECK